MQNLKEFLSFAEGEVRSLASLYSTVVGIPFFLLLFCSTLLSTFNINPLYLRVEVLMLWRYISERIQLVSHLNKVTFECKLNNLFRFIFFSYFLFSMHILLLGLTYEKQTPLCLIFVICSCIHPAKLC